VRRAEATEALDEKMQQQSGEVDEEDVDIRLGCVSSKSAASRRHGHQRHHHRRVLFLDSRLAEYQLPVAAIKMDAADILIIYEAFLCSLTERDDSGKDSATFSADIGGHLP
jgi:DNA-binding NtrC family response regulator